MASLFSELYTDFVEQIKVYTPELDVTPLQFMRYLTQGMQDFQKRVELIERLITINIDPTDNVFYVPNDMLRIVQLKDSCGHILVSNNINQLDRNDELWEDGKLETPTDYSTRLTSRSTIDDNGQKTRLYSVYRRVIELIPNLSDTILHMRYIPDIQAISQNSSQWTLWYPINTNFNARFISTGMAHSLAPYENAILAFAVAKYVKSKGSANYKTFEQEYMTEVEKAKIEKPSQFREGVRDYFMSPYS